MPKLDLASIAAKRGSDYPPPHDREVAGREARLLGAAGGLTDFVVAYAVIPPDGWSSQRHWHEGEDEVVVVVAGGGVLVEEAMQTRLGPGDIAVFPKGHADGHHIVNDGDSPLVLVGISLPERSPCHYPDLNMVWSPEGGYESDIA